MLLFADTDLQTKDISHQIAWAESEFICDAGKDLVVERSSICEGREFIARPARLKFSFENMLLRLCTKAES